MKTLALITSASFLALASPSFADGHLAWEASEGASVYFINLEDGATVTSPVLVQMGVRGMGVAPAGTEKEGTGHHHLLVNRAAMGEGEEDEWLYGLPGDENHIHYGGGQTEATLELAPGEHTIQMVFGDMNHVPFGPQMVTEVINIIVK